MSSTPDPYTALEQLSEARILEAVLAAAQNASGTPSPAGDEQGAEGPDPTSAGQGNICPGDVGPGDDAAVLTLPHPRLVISTDTLTEGHDFLPGTTTARWIGRKAAVQNLADIAAMGSRPLAVLSALSLPASQSVAVAAEITAGLTEVCARYGARLIGGDLGAADALSLTVTALGTLPTGQAAVRRSGARPGDAVMLAATQLGSSASGLTLVLSGRVRRLPGALQNSGPLDLSVPARLTDAALQALTHHNAPEPDLACGWRAAPQLSAMIDLSDGLVRDASRIAAASDVLVDLDPAAIDDLSGAHRDLASALGEDPRDWVLHSGEEHAMLATAFPREAAQLPSPWRRIGTVRAVPPGMSAAESRDSPRVLLGGEPIAQHGWDHFEV